MSVWCFDLKNRSLTDCNQIDQSQESKSRYCESERRRHFHSSLKIFWFSGQIKIIILPRFLCLVKNVFGCHCSCTIAFFYNHVNVVQRFGDTYNNHCIYFERFVIFQVLFVVERRYVVKLDTASSIFSYKSIDQSKLRFSLFIRFVNGCDLRATIFPLHSTASTSFKLCFQLFQSTSQTFFLFSG